MATTVSNSSAIGSVSSAGLGSGLDVNSIVTKLMQLESIPLQTLKSKEASFQSKITALGQFKSDLSTLQSAAQTLDNVGQYSTTKTTSSDTTVANVTANADAIPGNFSLNIVNLAKAQKLVSGNFSNSSATVGSGTLSFQFGSFANNTFSANPNVGTQSITIAPGQNTLSGIRDAINNSNIGVNATIVNDANGAKLLFSSNKTGSAYSLKITTTDDGATPSASLAQLAYNPASVSNPISQLQAAQNANVTIDGLSVSSDSNSLVNVVDGLTINLLKESGNTSISTVKDASAATNAIASFVTAYNKLLSSANNLTFASKGSGQDGPLVDDSTISTALSGIKAALRSSVNGLSGNYTNLVSVGLSFQKDGSLSLDKEKFSTALSSSPGNVARLFASNGLTSDQQIKYVSATSSTATTTSEISVSQPASRGKLVGSQAAALTITAGVNDSLSVTVDGKTATVTLSAGSYSASTLAAEIQSKINGNDTLKSNNISITAIANSGILTLQSTRYGANSTVIGLTGSAANDLFGTPTSTTGTDVIATVGNNTVTGSGQNLTTFDGLSLQITASAAGSYGNVTYSRGIGAVLATTLSKMIASDGLVQAKISGLQSSTKSLQNQQTELQNRLTTIEATYRKQYSTLDSLMSQMSVTSSYLTQQFAALQKNNS